jgi:ribulose-5-phosphate 4-epimerase/fuculose-1-phosphate aldolase
MTEEQFREEICRVGRSLFERGYVHASAGNISVHLDESEGGGFLITPTDACQVGPAGRASAANQW